MPTKVKGDGQAWMSSRIARSDPTFSKDRRSPDLAGGAFVPQRAEHLHVKEHRCDDLPFPGLH